MTLSQVVSTVTDSTSNQGKKAGDLIKRYSLEGLLLSIVISGLWALLLWWLCSRCHNAIAWGVFAAPYV